MRLSGVCLSILVCLSPVLAQHAPRAFPHRIDGPVVTFTESEVVATDVAPGTQVYFAGVSLIPADYAVGVAKPFGVATADANGRAVFSAEIETRSVWIVAGASGGYTVAAPEGMLLREMDFPGSNAAHGLGGIRRLDLVRYAIDTFLIRPGVGIWSGHYRDGGADDQDGVMNGRTEGEVKSMKPHGHAATPDEIAPGDILFLVDRGTLEFHAAKVGR